MSNEIPQVIGKYKVVGEIAKGGMGVVYKAIHPSLKRYVVIKKMTARGNAANAERFKKEAQILLDLQSPYIVHLFDYFTGQWPLFGIFYQHKLIVEKDCSLFKIYQKLNQLLKG